MNIKEFINKKAKEIEPLELKIRLSWWNLATTGEDNYAKELQKASLALRKLFTSTEEYDFLLSQQNHSERIEDRQFSILLNHYKENQIPQEKIERIVQIETEVESIYTNFRPLVEGKPLSNNELKEILVASTDSKKREMAWRASKEIGSLVETKILDLIQLRNESAQKAGYTNFYSMQLALQDFDEKRLFELLDQLNASLSTPWSKYKENLDKNLSQKMGIQVEELRPWHYQDPFFQEAPSQEGLNLDDFYKNKDIEGISQKFFASINLPVDDILARSDLLEREGKSQHAFCTCIDQNQDIRILCNLRDNENWMSVQLHELGHAVYDKFIDPNLPYLIREPAHICMTEAIAMFFGRFSKAGPFLRTFGENKEINADIVRKSQKQTADNLLVFAKWALVMIHFERAMYQQPQADLNSLWWDYVEKFQGLKRIPDRHLPDWAAKLHLACAPVYYQNYILGEMIASQLAYYMPNFESYSTQLPSKESGQWLKELFHLGRQFLWETTLEKVTGETLNPDYFVKDLTAGTAGTGLT